MLAIRVRNSLGETYERPARPLLAELLGRLDAAGDNFLVLDRIPSDPDVYLQVLLHADGELQLEHRAGSPAQHFQTRLRSAAEVVEFMAGWARQQKGWDFGPDWERLDFSADDAPAPPLPPEVERELEEAVRDWLRCGYDDRAVLTENAEEYLVDGKNRPVSRAQAEHLVTRLWRERVTEQADWVGETDPERLTRAFAALGSAGLTAREYFACCGNCGTAEIRAAGAADARGYVFFHSQCAQGAADGGDLYLLYGGFRANGEEAGEAAGAARAVAVGQEVVAALDAVGLRWLWDGSARDAVRVTGLDWRKRLTG